MAVRLRRGPGLSARCPLAGPARLSSVGCPSTRVAIDSVHPGFSVPVSNRRSAVQRRPQLVEAAQEHSLPRIPREQAENEAATRANDLHGNEDERVEKRLELHA